MEESSEPSILLELLREINAWNSRISSAEKFDLISLDLREAPVLIYFKEIQMVLGLNMKEDGYLQAMIGESKNELIKSTFLTMQLTDTGRKELMPLRTLFPA